MVMFINSKIDNITIKTIFTNPDNNKDTNSFIEIDNNKITTNMCIKNYGWYETRDIHFTINDKSRIWYFCQNISPCFNYPIINSNGTGEGSKSKKSF